MKKDQDSSLATRFKCSERAIRRMRSKGVNLEAPLEVVDFILNSKAATQAQLEACKAVVLEEKQKTA